MMAGQHRILPNSSSVYLVKTDLLGNILWTQTIDSGYWNTEGYSVKQCNDGGYIVAGTRGPIAFDRYIFVVKTDSIGNVQWAKTFGGNGESGAYSVIQSFDGTFVVTGAFNSNTVPIIKIDSIGNVIWEEELDNNGGVQGGSMIQTPDSGFVVCATFSTGINTDHLFAYKINSSGAFLWGKNYGTIHFYANRIDTTNDGGLIFGGSTDYFGAGNSDMLLMKTDGSGNLLWTKSYGSPANESVFSVKQTSDHGFVLTGVMDSAATGYGGSGYVVKTDSIGNVEWSNTYGYFSPAPAFTLDGLQTADGGYAFTGTDQSSNMVLIKTDSLGKNGCNDSSVTTQSFSANIPVNNVLADSIIIPINSATIIPYTNGADSVTTICASVGIRPITDNQIPITIFPNPTTNHFTITFPNTIYKGVIEIYNVLGKKIFSENITNVSQKEIRLNTINAGIYFVKVRDGAYNKTEKLVIE
jgi:hypothetical protein